jgi:hypothetical protein
MRRLHEEAVETTVKKIQSAPMRMERAESAGRA